MGGAKHNGTACTRVVREADPYAMHLVGDGVLDIPVCGANNHRRWFPWLSLWGCKGAPPVAESSNRSSWAGTWLGASKAKREALVPTRRAVTKGD